MTKVIRIIVVGGIAFLLCGLAYTIFSRDLQWEVNTQQRIKIYEKDYPNLVSIERAKGIMADVHYAAIVYSKQSTSWSDEGNRRVHSAKKADVLYTVFGEEHSSIEYVSSGDALPNYATFVGLCLSKDIGLYEPDNGYEFPATEELIESLKDVDANKFRTKESSVCH